MRFFSRHDLLQMEPGALVGLAECHGLEVEGKSAADLIDELSDWIEDFRNLALGGEEEED